MDAPLLIFSTTKRDSDLKYITKTNIPDNIALVYSDKRSIALASALEINRLKTSSNIDELVAWEEIKSTIEPGKATNYEILKRFLGKIGIRKMQIKQNFPVFFADALRGDGFEISIADYNILPQRLIKSGAEIAEIKRSAEITKLTFGEVERIFADSSVNSKGALVFEGEILTSERLRNIMESFCFHLGAIAEYSIVAGGVGACDPHNIGYGPLKANELIVVDFFPCSRTSGYYADVSRTFIKGQPNKEQSGLYHAVKHAHDLAISLVSDQVPVSKIMESVFEYFDSQGYPSDKLAKPPHGMIHGLGHGLGLDLHEPPRVGLCDDILQNNSVITIEPGLYYMDIGGVRIEDDILVKKHGAEVLTEIPYNWVIE